MALSLVRLPTDNPAVEVKDTGRFGLGLFVPGRLRKGALIADWTGGRVYESALASTLPNDPPSFVRDHAIQIGERTYIDTEGIGRYFSHSCEPNCGFDGSVKVVTMRDVENEWLSFDYAMSEDSDWRMDCRCETQSCRKVIGAASIVDRAVLEAYGSFVSSWLRGKYGL